MAKDNDDNKKLPETPGKVTGTIDARYLRASLGFDGTGSQHYSPIKFSESLEKSFDEWHYSTGGYKSREAHSKKEMSTSLEYEFRGFNIGGVSTTTETHHQSFVNDTRESTTVGDKGENNGGRKFSATKKETVIARGAPSVEYNNVGSSNPKVLAASGDSSNDYDKNLYYSIGEDFVRVIAKNDMGTVQEGDYSRHIQSGNWDTHIAQKARMYADNDILIESATKIVLKVGTSTITITPSNIEILANGGSGRIDLNN